ncbi:MAG: V-type ATP synthase subunit I, partial [Pseudomonadota bacterium]
MSIAPLTKLTLIGAVARKTEALAALQGLGCMHLIPLAPPPSEPERAAPRGAESALKALRFLSAVRDKRRQMRSDAGFDVEAFVREALELKQRLRDVGDRR